jgi:hypothetical protein
MVNQEAIVSLKERINFLKGVEVKVAEVNALDPADYFMNDIHVDKVFDTMYVVERDLVDEIVADKARLENLERWDLLATIHREWVETNKVQ